MKSEEKSPIVTAKDFTGAAAAAGAAAGQVLLVPASSATTVVALAAVMATLFPPVIMAMTEASARRLKDRGERFWKSLVADWAKNADLTPEEVAGRLEAKKDDPAVSDAVWRAVRGLMDAPNENAAVVLGVLAAQYGRENRRADPFFRGTVRLLGELSDDELHELSGMLEWVLSSTSEDRVLLVARDREKLSGEWRMVPWRVEFRKDYLAKERREEPTERAPTAPVYARCPITFSDPERLFTLLKAHGLGLESGYNPTFGGTPPNVELVRDTTERLATLLRARS